MSKQKLELNWIGKEKRPKLEPRILLEDPEKSYHATHRVTENDIFDNRLIFGDNLLALKALEQEFSGKVKCVFIDPPYNTGSAFTRYDDDGRSQFTLQNFETTRFTRESMLNLSTHGLTFVLDVPRVAHGERVFQQMVELAKRFAETLQGTLVDDNRQPLNDVQLDHIRREFIGKPQATMASYGIPAGSAQALRLFS